ncbi:hypothetical protein BJ508DRAFT_124470 [Ascobolus immersus RN42]|uniref:Uncharacterized protein n=1 Tax=Ascobolus immersus RN42 TaxID=1160509 RepID=A0A3N4I3T9_ASCIM|nr:hypothetical protein BJ508DRAFT_124470 [Ascobolus immersus RN42]
MPLLASLTSLTRDCNTKEGHPGLSPYCHTWLPVPSGENQVPISTPNSAGPLLVSPPFQLFLFFLPFPPIFSFTPIHQSKSSTCEFLSFLSALYNNTLCFRPDIFRIDLTPSVFQSTLLRFQYSVVFAPTFFAFPEPCSTHPVTPCTFEEHHIAVRTHSPNRHYHVPTNFKRSRQSLQNDTPGPSDFRNHTPNDVKSNRFLFTDLRIDLLNSSRQPSFESHSLHLCDITILEFVSCKNYIRIVLLRSLQ